MSINDDLLIIYLWREGHGESIYNEIKEYGLDIDENDVPCRIECLQITDVHTEQWLSFNAAQVDISNLPCFLLSSSSNDRKITTVIPVERKEEVYSLVVSHYLG